MKIKVRVGPGKQTDRNLERKRNYNIEETNLGFSSSSSSIPSNFQWNQFPNRRQYYYYFFFFRYNQKKKDVFNYCYYNSHSEIGATLP